ncbi:hypothetical protein TVNIR_0944 [Thioalkalivibrio nitratireducens DSM 14787]|uniref:Uncharacterized protein n=1 Tax=Thioalkalivibrio nitratireducens (strain DSM 14787 / UNIQEM 213 / ALEN2) TaxID=1255043 RepID=L0DW96_THIND|nr:hypothetical protein TVNIR_0944 [Thioalkalivibrio nitratireducens DSM 14787]
MILLLIAGHVSAGLDIDPYLPPVEPDLTDEERERRQEAVQRQIEEARRRAEEQARQEAEARRQREAELAARPYPVRLTEARCLGCHRMDDLLERPRTRLGWELVALRMQRFNGAHLEPGDRAVIAAHLARTYPAPIYRRVVEPLILIAILLVPLVVWWQWHKRRRPESR